MRKIAIFAFKGEAMCFVHALLNGLDLQAKGFDVKLVIEGAAVVQIKEQAQVGAPFKGLFDKAQAAGLIAGACRACSNKMNVLKDVEASGFPLLDDMAGHPSMAAYLEKGYEVITL